jgi:hypothetical protein
MCWQIVERLKVNGIQPQGTQIAYRQYFSNFFGLQVILFEKKKKLNKTADFQLKFGQLYPTLTLWAHMSGLIFRTEKSSSRRNSFWHVKF